MIVKHVHNDAGIRFADVIFSACSENGRASVKVSIALCRTIPF
jgi:hypothetical protein